MWHLDSGAAIDGATLLAAARFANAASDHALAERIARSAFDAKGGFAAGLELADAVSRQGRGDEAERLFVELAAIAEDDEQRAALAMRQAENAFLRVGDPDRATGLLEEARATVSDPATQMMLDVHLTLLLAFKPAPRAAFKKAAELIELANAPAEAVLEATTILQLMAIWLCDFPTVYRTAKHGLDVVAGADYPIRDRDARLLILQFAAQTHDGRVEEAVRGLREGYQQAITPPIDDLCCIWATNLSAALAIRGQVLDAVEVGRSGVLIGDRSDVAGHRAGLAGLLAVVAGQARDQATVDFALRKLEAAPIFTPPAGAWTPRAQAWQHALGGDTSRAAQLAVEAGEAALNDDIPLVASWAFCDTIQFGHAELVVEHLRDIAANTSAVTINAYAEHASALVAGEPEAVEKVAAGYQNRDEFLYAATAYLQASQLYRDQRRDHAAARAAIRARQLDTQLPPEVFAHTPLDLSRRETEVVDLAVQGLTSRQISERLYVSVRTVDNHLASAYTKLGVHSRDELAPILGGQEV
jgi:DNA-binding CsgD family transcriptional regulator